MIAGALVLALVAHAVVLFIAWPLVRPAGAGDRLDPLTDAQRRRLALREERDLALQAIKELEVDRATHHIGDHDYEELVAEYRARAAAAIAALDADEGAGAPASA
ncbi:MAG: hypothetical protein ACR2JV_07630 [Gaiellales bacterium]